MLTEQLTSYLFKLVDTTVEMQKLGVLSNDPRHIECIGLLRLLARRIVAACLGQRRREHCSAVCALKLPQDSLVQKDLQSEQCIC